jgi:cbb3-type cytochrome oxidase maturation protein
MNAVLITIPLALLLLALAVGAFFWAVDHDQFDDLNTPGLLPLDEAEKDADREDREDLPP